MLNFITYKFKKLYRVKIMDIIFHKYFPIIKNYYELYLLKLYITIANNYNINVSIHLCQDIDILYYIDINLSSVQTKNYQINSILKLNCKSLYCIDLSNLLDMIYFSNCIFNLYTMCNVHI